MPLARRRDSPLPDNASGQGPDIVLIFLGSLILNWIDSLFFMRLVVSASEMERMQCVTESSKPAWVNSRSIRMSFGFDEETILNMRPTV
jgi:hypothetical protein